MFLFAALNYIHCSLFLQFWEKNFCDLCKLLGVVQLNKSSKY